MKSIKLIDTTLRDGEQAPGISFSYPQKLKIIDTLIKTGIDEIEIGIPAMGIEEINFIKQAIAEHPNYPFLAWCRARSEDLIDAKKSGIKNIHIAFPVSSIHLHSFNLDFQNIIHRFYNLIEQGRDSFDFISIGIMDSFRSSQYQITEMLKICEKLQVNRIRLSDTVGSALPDEIFSLIEFTKCYTSLPIEFHGHNDLGLSTANTYSAIMAGAEAIDTTVNGLGERAGNTCMAEIVMIGQQSGRFKTNVNSKKLYALAEIVSDFSGQEIAPDKPLIGNRVFCHESGIHCKGLLKNPLAFQGVFASAVGNPFSGLKLGKHSGSSFIQAYLKEKGIQISRNDARKILDKFRYQEIQQQNYESYLDEYIVKLDNLKISHN